MKVKDIITINELEEFPSEIINLFASPFYSKNIIEDLSFFMKNKEQIVGFMPLFLEKFNNIASLTFSGEYLSCLRSPVIFNCLNKKEIHSIFHKAINYIDEIAIKHKVSKCSIMIDPISECSNFIPYNLLMENDFIDISTNTLIIDLTDKEENLWRDLRKSYKSIINSSLINHKIKIYDHTNINEDIFKQYCNIHYLASGRKTRDKKTFDIQFDMIKNNEAFLSAIFHKNEAYADSFLFFMHSNYSSVYASGATNPDAKIKNSHSGLWKAIQYLKNKKIKKLELDTQFYSRQLFETPSQKEINISYFKKGFGGSITTLFRGVKYYDKDLLLSDLNQFINEIKN